VTVENIKEMMTIIAVKISNKRLKKKNLKNSGLNGIRIQDPDLYISIVVSHFWEPDLELRGISDPKLSGYPPTSISHLVKIF